MLQFAARKTRTYKTLLQSAAMVQQIAAPMHHFAASFRVRAAHLQHFSG